MFCFLRITTIINFAQEHHDLVLDNAKQTKHRCCPFGREDEQQEEHEKGLLSSMVWLIHSGVSSFATSLCSGRSIQSQPRFAAKSFVSLGTFLEQSLPKHPSSQPHGLGNLFCIPKKVWSKASPFLPTQAQGTELICSDAPHAAHHHLFHFESHLAPESDDGCVHKVACTWSFCLF